MEDIYMVVKDDGKFMRSGSNHTVATFSNLGVAKGQVTRYGGQVVKVTDYELVETIKEDE